MVGWMNGGYSTDKWIDKTMQWEFVCHLWKSDGSVRLVIQYKYTFLGVLHR